MSKGHLRLALRVMQRDKRYALINVIGLAVGVGCFLMLALYLADELTFDRHFEQHERIFRVVSERRTGGKVDLMALTSTELGPLLAHGYPEVEEFVRLVAVQQQQILRRGDVSFYWDDVLLADPQVFRVFSHRIIHGDPATALDDPLSIAISERMAKRYFGDANPIGETLATDTAGYTVTLVFADLPANTHLRYDALLSYNRIKAFQGEVNVTEALWNLGAFTYVSMTEGYRAESFAALSERFYDTHMRARGEEMGSAMRFRLEPLADVHLGSRTQYDRPSGNRFYLLAFAAIALFVLGVACINYMNLATARAARRSMEVGMRKVLGATRRQLVGQFLGESLVFSFVALLLAMVFLQVVLTFTDLQQLLGRPLTLDLAGRPWLVAVLVGLGATVGLVSGLYPALYLASIPPIAALKGRSSGGHSGRVLRQSLVFLQFAISVGVIACALLMAVQLHYVQSKPLGFEKANRVIVRLQGADTIEKVALIKNELSRHSGMLGVAQSNHVPGFDPGVGQSAFITVVQVDNADGVLEPQTVNGMNVGNDFLDVMGMELVAGRTFDDASRWQDSVIVNETLVERMGWRDPLGKRVLTGGPIQAQVIGVVKDFHYESLHEPVNPLMLTMVRTDFSGMDRLNRAIVWSLLVLELAPERTAEALEFVRARWSELDPKHPFEYAFLEDEWSSLYGSEARQMQLIGLFAAVCIVISCLGLYGLSAFDTAQRTREIGIRRILGASVGSIVLLLFRNVLGLIAWGAVVASCVAYYVMGGWLAGFEYRQPINPLVFLLAATLAAGLAFLTVAAQSLRTARSNPAEALRHE